ncbi:MAG: glutamate--tRNA ligase [Planctomycetes bacterium]|nr:glutamate--tRNA ligase [Planctomycetota bacterium]
MASNIRVRFAPSPTGKLHIGGARTALFNWAYARRHGGAFLLRIEDTDPERSTKEYELAILDGLRWLGIHWDEGPDVGGPHAPYHQSQRIARHREMAARLLSEGRAYHCFCSRERLEELNKQQEARKEKSAYDGRCRPLAPAEAAARVEAGEPNTLRFAVPQGTTRFHDLIRGEMSFDNREVEDWVMVRSDGSPTYNFVVVCDDIDMRISHVFRGEEHLVNTPKQVLLYRSFSAPTPEFGHLPLMLGTDRKKLSKRTGDTALQDYREKGFPREAVVNFLCLQGWALNGTQEIFSVEELVAHFDIKDVTKGGAIFDMEKFLWMSGEYIRRDSVEHVAEMCAPFVEAAGLASESELQTRRAWYHALVAGSKERIRTYSELPGQIAYLFASDEKLVYEETAERNARKHAGRVETLRAFLEWLRPRIADGVDVAALREGVKLFQTERGLKTPELLQPLRCALSGMAGGPDTLEVLAWLGPQRSLRRLELALERLS